MLDRPDSDSPVLDPLKPARVYRDYLLKCRRLGIMPASPDRAKAILKEWADAIEAGLPKPSVRHEEHATRVPREEGRKADG